MKLELSVNSQSVETSGITKDYREALCEYIWNGFEANATQVMVDFDYNELGGVEEVTIQDNGDGINYDTIAETFGTFLASHKNSHSLQSKSKANKGKGRFSCFSFATDAKWITTASSNEGNIQYTISINCNNKSEFEISDPIHTEKSLGTILRITGINTLKDSDVSFEALEDSMLKTFAWYLYLNKNRNLTISINGQVIDYTKYIDTEFSLTEKVNIESQTFIIAVIVWAEKIRENYCAYYLDETGVLCGKDFTKFNRNAANFNHSVYIKSQFFNGKDNVSLNNQNSEIDGQISIEENDKTILRKLRRHLQEIIGNRLNAYLSKQADEAVQKMMQRNSFPIFNDDIYGEMRRKDLIRVTKELYCLDSRIFRQLKPIQEKSFLAFLNLLLNSKERENILSIIEEIVELTPEQRATFSCILRRTKLDSIINTIKFIEDRYKVVEALKQIVFNLDAYSTERDHIQKIIEQHYWLFGEQYHLVSADQRMKKALEQYLYLLYGDAAPDTMLQSDEEEIRRMDIFLCGARKTQDGTGTHILENLIVELKAPKVILSKTVLRQIEDYMYFIRKQPQFNSQYREWKFIAVCKEVDDYVKSRYKAEAAKGKKGLVTQIENCEVYALTWDDVFNSFELRHSFVLDNLKIDQEAILAELEAETGKGQSRETADALTSICTA